MTDKPPALRDIAEGEITTKQMQGALSMLLLKEREHLRKNPQVHDYLKAISARLAGYDALGADNARLKAEVGKLKCKLTYTKNALANTTKRAFEQKVRAEKAEAYRATKGGKCGVEFYPGWAGSPAWTGFYDKAKSLAYRAAKDAKK